MRKFVMRVCSKGWGLTLSMPSCPMEWDCWNKPGVHKKNMERESSSREGVGWCRAPWGIMGSLTVSSSGFSPGWNIEELLRIHWLSPAKVIRGDSVLGAGNRDWNLYDEITWGSVKEQCLAEMVAYWTSGSDTIVSTCLQGRVDVRYAPGKALYLLRRFPHLLTDVWHSF